MTLFKKKPKKPSGMPPFACLFACGALIVALYGCHPADLKKEAPKLLPEIGSGLVSVIANPAGYSGWTQFGGGLAALIAAAVGGKVAYNKVRGFLGKDQDTDPDAPVPPPPAPTA